MQLNRCVVNEQWNKTRSVVIYERTLPGRCSKSVFGRGGDGVANMYEDLFLSLVSLY